MCPIKSWPTARPRASSVRAIRAIPTSVKLPHNCQATCAYSRSCATHMESIALIPSNSPEWTEYVHRTNHDFFHTVEYHRVAESFRTRHRVARHLRHAGTLRRLALHPAGYRQAFECAPPKDEHHDITSVYGYTGPLSFRLRKRRRVSGLGLGRFRRSLALAIHRQRLHPPASAARQSSLAALLAQRRRFTPSLSTKAAAKAKPSPSICLRPR